jgi:hypothetical protein
VKEFSRHRQHQQTDEDKTNHVTIDQNKAGDRQSQQTDAAADNKRLTADAVTGQAYDRLHEQHTDHDRDNDQYTVIFRVVQVMRQVARHVSQQHVIGHVG